MPNPQGTNQYGALQPPEVPYGKAGAEDALNKSAPVPGASPLNAPQRAQRKAVSRPQQQQPQQPQPVGSSPDAQVAAFWTTLMQEAGDRLPPDIVDYAHSVGL